MITKASVEEQLSVLLRGVEYGDANIQRTMEEDLRARLSEGRPLRVYAGFDPTVRDLHLGYIVPMLKLRQFQRFGHEVTFLMGTMTGTIGDPTDRTAARQMRTRAEVEELVETWVGQASRILDPEKTTFERNAKWLAPLDFEDIVQLASHFTVQQFLERQGFRERLDTGKPIYLHEFMYPLMQGYDAVALKTDVQVGGVDQLFNIMAGRNLQRDLGQKGLVAVCVPLLIGTDGHHKMSQSLGNYIALDAEPADMYGKVMSIPDELIVNWFTLLVPELSSDELAAIERGLVDRSLNPMEAKKRLARSVVALLHGQDAAAAAEAEFERVFQRREEPEEAIEVKWSSVPLSGDEANLPGLFARALDMSISEGRRLIAQGAVEVDGQKATTNLAALAPGALIKVGRHRFLRITE